MMMLDSGLLFWATLYTIQWRDIDEWRVWNNISPVEMRHFGVNIFLRFLGYH